MTCTEYTTARDRWPCTRLTTAMSSIDGPSKTTTTASPVLDLCGNNSDLAGPSGPCVTAETSTGVRGQRQQVHSDVFSGLTHKSTVQQQAQLVLHLRGGDPIGSRYNSARKAPICRWCSTSPSSICRGGGYNQLPNSPSVVRSPYVQSRPPRRLSRRSSP